MTFAVTGSSGFVGRSLINALFSRGIPYLALSRQRSSNSSSFSAKFHQVDYTNIENLRRLLFGCDFVVHLAGLAHQFVPNTSAAQDSFHFANVEVLRNTAIAASRAGVKKFIYISSIGVLGRHTFGEPFSDFSIPQPTTPYSASKLDAEFLLRDISNSTSLPFVILRPPLVYGQHCPGNLAKLVKLMLYSPILPFGSLSSMRSLLSVNHLVDMIIRSAIAPCVVNDAYVLSDSIDLTLRDIFLSLIKGLGKSDLMLVDLDLRILSIASRLLGREDAFLQLSSELIVDSSRFCEAANWIPFLSPHAELELTARSFLN